MCGIRSKLTIKTQEDVNDFEQANVSRVSSQEEIPPN